jgi:hypothetical protein
MPRKKQKGSSDPKPSDGGKHKTPRTAINFPKDWYALIRDRSGARAQPKLWYLIELVRKDAEQAGVEDIPPVPWKK